MSTDNADAVSQQIAELERLRRQTQRFNLWTTLALATIVIVGVGAIINSFYGLTISGPKQHEFLKHLGGQFQNELLPTVQKFADPSVKRLKPVVEAELKRLDARAPEVANVALRELGILGTNLPMRATVVLEQTLGKQLQARNPRLHQLFPGVTDQQITALLDTIQLDAQEQLVKTGEKLFNPHLNSIHSILANLEKIEQTEAVNPNQEINPWQVAFLFADVFTHEFKDLAVPQTSKPQETLQ